jgi:hypothetical protein
MAEPAKSMHVLAFDVLHPTQVEGALLFAVPHANIAAAALVALCKHPR